MVAGYTDVLEFPTKIFAQIYLLQFQLFGSCIKPPNKPSFSIILHWLFSFDDFTVNPTKKCFFF